MRAKKTGNEQRLQLEGHTLPGWGFAFIVAMAVHARFCTARTALGAVGFWIVLKALEVS